MYIPRYCKRDNFLNLISIQTELLKFQERKTRPNKGDNYPIIMISCVFTKLYIYNVYFKLKSNIMKKVLKCKIRNRAQMTQMI